MSAVIEDSLEHLVSGIVEHPEDVSVRVRSGRRGSREQGGAPTRCASTPTTSVV